MEGQNHAVRLALEKQQERCSRSEGHSQAGPHQVGPIHQRLANYVGQVEGQGRRSRHLFGPSAELEKWMNWHHMQRMGCMLWLRYAEASGKKAARCAALPCPVPCPALCPVLHCSTTARVPGKLRRTHTTW